MMSTTKFQWNCLKCKIPMHSFILRKHRLEHLTIAVCLKLTYSIKQMQRKIVPNSFFACSTNGFHHSLQLRVCHSTQQLPTSRKHEFAILAILNLFVMWIADVPKSQPPSPLLSGQINNKNQFASRPIHHLRSFVYWRIRINIASFNLLIAAIEFGAHSMRPSEWRQTNILGSVFCILCLEK